MTKCYTERIEQGKKWPYGEPQTEYQQRVLAHESGRFLVTATTRTNRIHINGSIPVGATNDALIMIDNQRVWLNNQQEAMT